MLSFQLILMFFINHELILDMLITFSKYDKLFHQKLGHGIINLAFHIIRALHFELVIPGAYFEAGTSTSQVNTFRKKNLLWHSNLFLLNKSVCVEEDSEMSLLFHIQMVDTLTVLLCIKSQLPPQHTMNGTVVV